MQRKPVAHSAPGSNIGVRNVMTVDLPLPYEGIGKALRASFHPSRADMPSDMLDLLHKLDKI